MHRVRDSRCKRRLRLILSRHGILQQGASNRCGEER